MESELIFLVEELPGGGYVARAQSQPIYTQGANPRALVDAIREAVRCHYDGNGLDKIPSLRAYLDSRCQNVELLQREINQLLLGAAPAEGSVDAIALAISLAEDLGPGFSSENPDALVGRGDGWFGEP